VHPAIALITTLATVIHFTFGCCLHASHFDGAGDCCPGDRAIADLDSCCEDHGHEQDLPGVSADRGEPARTPAHGTTAGAASECECAGCTCAATVTNTDVFSPGSPPLAWDGLSFVVGPMTRFARGDCTGHRCPVPSELRPPLFERLLV